MDNKDEASFDNKTFSDSGYNEENATKESSLLSSSSEAISQDSTTEEEEAAEEASHETDEEEEKKKETSSSASHEEAKDKETSLLSSRTHQDSIKEQEEAENAEEKRETSSSDVESSEKKVTDEEAEDKETSVLPSSSGTNQDSIKETEEEEAEAEEKEQDSIFSDILTDIEANPNILDPKSPDNIFRFDWFEDSAPLGSNPAVLRQLQEKLELIDINNCVLESLKRRRQEAIKLGVNLSLLVAEAMFFSPDKILKMTADTLQGFLKRANGPLKVDGVVVFYLTQVFNRLRKLARLPIPIPRADEYIDPSNFKKFLRLFSDAIVVLERVIRGIHDLSDTVVLEEEPEKLSALDSAIEDCGKQLSKIDVAIQEAKQLCVIKGLGSIDKTNEVLRNNLEDDFFRLWNNLFPAAWSPDTDSDLTDGDD